MAATEISVDHIARVEGHGDIRLVIEDGQVTTCEMAVVEPARLFESMVHGRTFSEIPYIASRICGICSCIHANCYCNAIEDMLGVTAPPRAQFLRVVWSELHRIHSHLLWLGLFADALVLKVYSSSSGAFASMSWTSAKPRRAIA